MRARNLCVIPLLAALLCSACGSNAASQGGNSQAATSLSEETSSDVSGISLQSTGLAVSIESYDGGLTTDEEIGQHLTAQRSLSFDGGTRDYENADILSGVFSNAEELKEVFDVDPGTLLTESKWLVEYNPTGKTFTASSEEGTVDDTGCQEVLTWQCSGQSFQTYVNAENLTKVKDIKLSDSLTGSLYTDGNTSYFACISKNIFYYLTIRTADEQTAETICQKIGL